MSAVLALGKIPIVGIFRKKILYTALASKMQEFCMIEGNEQYQSLIKAWELAVFNFTPYPKSILPQKLVAEINLLQQLRSLKWQVFELKFTNWLKENNQTEIFIRNKVEDIIVKNTDTEPS